jgi:hypothetical protein
MHFGTPGGFGGGQMVGGIEREMPQLFNLELVDVKLIDLPSDHPHGISLDYARKRVPVAGIKANPVSYDSVSSSTPYKLILLGRRPGVKDAPIMEVDPCIGVGKFNERFFLYIARPMISDVNGWIKTGKIPEVYRPPNHSDPESNFPDDRYNKIPDGWIPIVRPRK